MDRGLFTAASGGLLAGNRLDVVANNLANINTVGFKAQRLRSRQQEFTDTLAGQMNGEIAVQGPADHARTPGVVEMATYTDFTPGPVHMTENPLDVALNKENQFFVVQTPEGETYTRAGNFSLTSDGTLVTQDGKSVLGDGGPITLPSGKARISNNGSVIVEGQTVGRLRVAQIDDLTKLERAEGTRFKLIAGAPAPQAVEAEVTPGAVEMPNVTAIEAMVEMINAQKAFEAYTKTVRTIDELNDAAIRNARSS